MKSIFTGLLLWLSLYSFSQNTVSIADSCLTAKPLPCKEANNQVIQIDTIESSKFGFLVDNLYSKMWASQELTVEEDRTLVLLMNTLNWLELDNQIQLQTRYPKLSSIADFFDKMYKRKLHCKYKVCIGSGFSSYFIELKTQYMGNPFSCSRYLVKMLGFK